MPVLVGNICNVDAKCWEEFADLFKSHRKYTRYDISPKISYQAPRKIQDNSRILFWKASLLTGCCLRSMFHQLHSGDFTPLLFMTCLILSLFHPLPSFPVLNASVFPLISSYGTTFFLPSFHYERINNMLVNNGLLLNQAYSLCFSVVKKSPHILLILYV